MGPPCSVPELLKNLRQAAHIFESSQQLWVRACSICSHPAIQAILPSRPPWFLGSAARGLGLDSATLLARHLPRGARRLQLAFRGCGLGEAAATALAERMPPELAAGQGE